LEGKDCCDKVKELKNKYLIEDCSMFKVFQQKQTKVFEKPPQLLQPSTPKSEVKEELKLSPNG
jgi:hypothetical protein